MMNHSKVWGRDTSWLSTHHWSASVALSLSRTLGAFPALNTAMSTSWVKNTSGKHIVLRSTHTLAVGICMGRKHLETCWRSKNCQVHPLTVVCSSGETLGPLIRATNRISKSITSAAYTVQNEWRANQPADALEISLSPHQTNCFFPDRISVPLVTKDSSLNWNRRELSYRELLHRQKVTSI